MFCDGRRTYQRISNVLAVMTHLLENVGFTPYLIPGTGSEMHVYAFGLLVYLVYLVSLSNFIPHDVALMLKMTEKKGTLMSHPIIKYIL